MTSFGALARVRTALCRALGVKKIKIGHAGTLDPLATGVLILCTGKRTKDIEALQVGKKEYTATLQIGSTTPSFDREYTVDYTYPTSHVTEALVKETISNFVGVQEQVPPEYSACKVDGKRAYSLARKGQQVALKAKVITIDEIELSAFDKMSMRATIHVVCSKGTYIRALARDIGVALGSGAHLLSLCRTRVGDVTLDQCTTIDEFQERISNFKI